MLKWDINFQKKIERLKRGEEVEVFVKVKNVRRDFKTPVKVIKKYLPIKYVLIRVKRENISKLARETNVLKLYLNDEITINSENFPRDLLTTTYHRFLNFYNLSEDDIPFSDTRRVKLGIIDSGIDMTNPELRKYVYGFKGNIDETMDFLGHGTAVASIILLFSNPQLYIVNVFHQRKSKINKVIDACEYMKRKKVDIINLSLGTKKPYSSKNPLSEELDYLYHQHKIISVVSAGNNGPSFYTIGTPASTKTAITVGAVDDNRIVLPFSSRGATLDDIVKPDCVALGNNIIMLRSDGITNLSLIDSKRIIASGTSFSAPQVSAIISWGINKVPSNQLLKQLFLDSCEIPYPLIPNSKSIEIFEELLDRKISEKEKILFSYGRGIINPKKFLEKVENI